MRFVTGFLMIFLAAVLTFNTANAGPSLGISKVRAVQIAQHRFPGKIIKIQSMQTHYRIRILQSSGRVVTILVDGRTGRIKKEQ